MKYISTVIILFFCILTVIAAPPNILVLLAGDLGYSDLSCYGSKNIKTPHRDKLAKQGSDLPTFMRQRLIE